MVELQDLQGLIDFLTGLPPIVAYLVIAGGSALENVFPPVPSDTFIVLGAVGADRGNLEPLPILLGAWLANLAGAMAVYGLARRRGPAFFHEGWAQRILRPHQFARITIFYERYGLWAIFFSRFLPVLRVVIPTFAGFAGLGTVRTLIPVATASLLWTGVMLWAGIFASQNVGRLLELLGRANTWLLVVAGAVFLSILYWWIRSRRDHAAVRTDPEDDEGLSSAIEEDRDDPSDAGASSG